MTTKDKFIQLNIIHSTKRESQTIIGLTAEGRVFKGILKYASAYNDLEYVWNEIKLPEELK